jgi:ATP-dependent protease HslVU (ClpYQ) peptidase subunit
MTTIVYSKGVMASDSGVWVEGILVYKTKKLHRLKNGCVAGFAGAVNDALTILRWMDGDETEKPKFDEVTMLVASPTGRVLKYDAPKPISIKRPKYISIGTGYQVALGALHQGATAYEAVKAAIEHDAHSRGPIHQMKV